MGNGYSCRCENFRIDAQWLWHHAFVLTRWQHLLGHRARFAVNRSCCFNRCFACFLVWLLSYAYCCGKQVLSGMLNRSHWLTGKIHIAVAAALHLLLYWNFLPKICQYSWVFMSCLKTFLLFDMSFKYHSYNYSIIELQFRNDFVTIIKPWSVQSSMLCTGPKSW